MTPSQELIAALQTFFDHFNRSLFEGRLPMVMLLVQREAGVMGHYSKQRWVNGQGLKAGEISINPTFIAKSRLIEVCQTVVHEMCHHWQHCFGKPSRQCYHNKEWARQMIKVGLMPSSTGEPGGDITGQGMSDYPLEGGPFHLAYLELLKCQADHLPWVDRRAVERINHTSVVSANEIVLDDCPGAKELAQYHSELLGHDFEPPEEYAALTQRYGDAELLCEYLEEWLPLEAAKTKTRYRYLCDGCGLKVYGKWGISIRCNECDQDFVLRDD